MTTSSIPIAASEDKNALTLCKAMKRIRSNSVKQDCSEIIERIVITSVEQATEKLKNINVVQTV
jgi:hypothetical protein